MKKRKPLNIIFVTNDEINKSIEETLVEEIAYNIVKKVNIKEKVEKDIP